MGDEKTSKILQNNYINCKKIRRESNNRYIWWIRFYGFRRNAICVLL